MKKVCVDCGKVKSKKGIYCRICRYRHVCRPSGLKYVLKKENPTSFKKGNKSWNIGIMTGLGKYSDGYDAIHEWVERWMGKPKKCEFCGSQSNLEWANKTGEYKRTFYDWLRLCRKCHHKYDFENFGMRSNFYKVRVKKQKIYV